MNAWLQPMTISGNSYVYMHSLYSNRMGFTVAILDSKAHVIVEAAA